MNPFEKCELCEQIRGCNFCDLEALKATVEGRPWPYKYIKTFEGYKRVINFAANNTSPKPNKKSKVIINYGTIPSSTNLEILSDILKSNIELSKEFREWLAGLFAEENNYTYYLKISKRGTRGQKERTRFKNWTAAAEYKNLLDKGINPKKAKDEILVAYNLDNRSLNTAIKNYHAQLREIAGQKPLPKQGRGRPKYK